MSNFSEEVSVKPSQSTSVINAIDAKMEGNQLILTDENDKQIILTLTEDALKQLPEVLSSTPPPEKAGGSKRRKSRKHKVVKRRNKSHRRHRH
uniref:Uncharacterized protein n=1 Tax=viral metagenome TaxID=1070528 RepID=A0A6C0AR70_9ZZZZ